MERLDKILALHNVGSRKEAGALVRAGAVTVNGRAAARPEQKVDPEQDEIAVHGRPLTLRRHVYLMMNKPAGVLSAARDKNAPTVMDLLPPQLRRRGLFPAGRLDKDTEGLLLLTDDGGLAHRMLSPKSHVYKLYEARLDRPAQPGDQAAFAAGLQAGELSCLPARLSWGEDPCLVQVEVREGKFHQVKRMFHAVGKEVVALRRLRIGGLSLDPALSPGQARFLTGEEVEKIFLPQAVENPTA